jgi:hypothetical protein
MPYNDWEPDLNNGTDGGFSNGNPGDGLPIPDVMELGGSWLSRDGCEYIGGYKSCGCVIRYDGSDPHVECDSRCRYD